MKAVLPRGIRKRGNSFLVDATVGGVRRTRTCSSLEDAKQIHAKLTEARPSSGWSLQEAFETTRDRIWSGSKSEEHLVRNGKQAVAYFGASTSVDSLSLSRIEAWCTHLEDRGASNATVNRKLAALSRMLTVAHQRGGLAVKPHIPRRKEGQGRIRYLTDQEERDAIEWLTHLGLDDVRDAFLVLVDTGMRTGELWKLEARDVHNGMIHVWDPKNSVPRSIPMTRRVTAVLSKRHGPRLFPYDNWWMRRGWDKLKARMRLTEDTQFVPHCLRHTCASRLVQRGVPLAVVQQWLGHKTITVTMRYAHLAPANLQLAKEALENDTSLRVVGDP